MEISAIRVLSTTKAVIILAIICNAILVFDSIYVSIALSLEYDPDPLLNNILFIILVVFFGISNYSFFKYVNIDHQLVKAKSQRDFSKLFVAGCQITIGSILVLLVFQSTFFSAYSLFSVSLIIYLSHICAIIFTSFLTYRFVLWFLGSRNYLIFLYTLSFSVITLTIILSAIYLESQNSLADQIVTHTSIDQAVTEYSNLGSSLATLATIQTYASVVSFVSIWIPTAIALKTHYQRPAVYWCAVLIPLIFFLFPFLVGQLGAFDVLFLEYGKQFSLIYYLIFGPYQQIGGLLFGIAFWLTARRIRRDQLRTLVNISGIGISLLFGSLVIHGLTYTVIPPFGLVTVSFMAFASYMLFIGLYRSAKELTSDSSVRREIYKIAGEEYDLLRTIGLAELNRTVKSRVDPLLKKIEKEEGIQIRDEMHESDYKKFVAEAIQALEERKRLRNEG